MFDLLTFGNIHSMETNCDIVIVPVKGDLNVITTPRLEKVLSDFCKAGCRRIILNMAEVEYVDSCGMALLVNQTKKMRKLGGNLSLTNVTDQVYRSLCIACLVDFIPVSLKAKVSVPVLDPSARPLWKRTMQVEPDDMELIRKRVQNLLESLPMSKADVYDMTLAGGEAIGNAIDHTSSKDVFVTITGYSDRVIMEVTDSGCGFELKAGQELKQTCCERGRGIKLMRLLTDSVEISKKTLGQGTVVKLVKLVKPKNQYLD